MFIDRCQNLFLKPWKVGGRGGESQSGTPPSNHPLRPSPTAVGMRDEERRLIEILLPGEIREIPTRFQDLLRRLHRRHCRRRRQRYFRRKMHARFSLLTFYGGLLMVYCPFPVSVSSRMYGKVSYKTRTISRKGTVHK